MTGPNKTAIRAIYLTITDEQARILRAAVANNLYRNEQQRWLIAAQPRPDRRERERLVKRNLLAYPAGDFDRLIPTPRGVLALAKHIERSEVA